MTPYTTKASAKISLPFAHCARCHCTMDDREILFSSCGHFLCARHITSEKSCAACGKPGIYVFSLTDTFTSNKSPQRLPKEMRQLVGNFLPYLKVIHNVARYQYSRIEDLLKHQNAKIASLEHHVEELKEHIGTTTMKSKERKS